MTLSLKPSHLKRYKDVLVLLAKYGRGDLLRSSGLDAGLDDLPPDDVPSKAPEAKQLAADLEKMGPTFIKLGQLLSTRGDLLPIPYIESLSRLQNGVEPFPFEDVEKIVTEELGVRLSRGFSSFEETPLASASLGQVHRAALRDGRVVAVKVQRPGIRERITEDFEALGEIAALIDDHSDVGRRYRFAPMLEEFRKSLFRELDYRLEAKNLNTLADNLQEFPRLVVPRPVDDYSSARVLTMDYLEGSKVDSLDPMVRSELGGPELGDQLFRAYLKQILVDGFLHADPHPGNVLMTRDGRLALLDLGMVVTLPQALQKQLLRFMLGISEGNPEEAVAASLDMAEVSEDFERAPFEKLMGEIVSRHQHSRVEDLELGKVILQAVRGSADCGVRFPPELSMVGQTFLKLDTLGRTLAPDFKPNDSIRQNAFRAIQKQMSSGISWAGAFRSAMELKDFAQELPGRVNRILDAVADRELEVKVRAFDETKLLEGFQKIANRITLGLVLAGLIIGAALLMRVETSFRILGYPGLAILFFMAAAVGGFALVWRIVMSDAHPRSKRSATTSTRSR